MRLLLQTVSAISALAICGAAHAEVVHYKAALDGASEVPLHAVPGKGMAMIDLDTATKVMTYKIDYSGLTGPASMAHFHGPAAAGVNAPPVVVIPVVPSPLSGTATLTDAQIADLNGGKWYVNIHTKANPGGEIRGQVMHAK